MTSIRSGSRQSPASPTSAAGTTAPADRVRRSAAWRDPRLAFGALLVAASVVLGALVLGGDDPGAPVWQVSTDLAAGSVIEDGDLQTVRIPLPEGAEAAYVSAAQPLPAGSVTRRAVAAGELLPAGALERSGPGSALVPISVGDDGVPGTIRAGSVVDVWVVPASAVGAAPDATDVLASEAEQVLDDVTVVGLPSGVSLGGGSPQPLVVGVEESAGVDLGEVLAQLAAGDAVVVGQG